MTTTVSAAGLKQPKVHVLKAVSSEVHGMIDFNGDGTSETIEIVSTISVHFKSGIVTDPIAHVSSWVVYDLDGDGKDELILADANYNRGNGIVAVFAEKDIYRLYNGADWRRPGQATYRMSGDEFCHVGRRLSVGRLDGRIGILDDRIEDGFLAWYPVTLTSQANIYPPKPSKKK